MTTILSAEALETLPALPPQFNTVKPGVYAIHCTSHEKSRGRDGDIRSKIWFKTPSMSLTEIDRIDGLQLYAESHDQGEVDEPHLGNWTWFEIAIFENSSSNTPRQKDGVELVWTSHKNRFQTYEYGWSNGTVFGKDHQLVTLLEANNVIGVRLCARFPGWRIDARTGFLVVNVGKESTRVEAIDFKPIIDNALFIQTVFDGMNKDMNASFIPSLSGGLVQSANNFTSIDKRPLRVLSLDGGGIRGLSSLYLLQAIMKKLPGNPKPCDVFDMIAGTSTGGLIAIMLGRLKMSVSDCIDEYEKLANKIFAAGRLKKLGNVLKSGDARYDSKILEDAIKEVIAKHMPVDTVLLEEKDPKCKVFVMTMTGHAIGNRAPMYLRSYINPQNGSELPQCRIWEAGRATSAAPTYFSPITVGKYQLVDAGMGANNPVGWLWNEVLDVFGPARSTDCFLSLGTGIPANQAVTGTNVLSGVSASATNSQLIHVLFKTLINAFAPTNAGKKYFRLNVGAEIAEWTETVEHWIGKDTHILHLQDYQDVGDLDDLTKLKLLKDLTTVYIADQANLIDEAAEALNRSPKQ